LCYSHHTHSFNKADDYGKYVSYACVLDGLTDSHLKELEKRVGEKYAIRESVHKTSNVGRKRVYPAVDYTVAG